MLLYVPAAPEARSVLVRTCLRVIVRRGLDG